MQIDKEKFRSRVMAIPFFLFHLSALAVFTVPVSTSLIFICLASYTLRMFAITGGYHRYFSHRSFKTSRVAQFLLALLGGTAVQKGALWWAAHHRWHHRYSDEPKDMHSPVQKGFWWSHVGWIIHERHDETRWELIQDLAKYPELLFLNKYHWIPGMLYAAIMYACLGWAGFIWGFLVSTVLLWHGTYTINSLSHVFGTARYKTGDASKNNFILAIITLGEGWHNNHHAYMSSTRQGFYWWEIDLTYYALKGLSHLKVVHEIRNPPLQLLEAKRVSFADEVMPLKSAG